MVCIDLMKEVCDVLMEEVCVDLMEEGCALPGVVGNSKRTLAFRRNWNVFFFFPPI
jgi:hypothetical protein